MIEIRRGRDRDAEAVFGLARKLATSTAPQRGAFDESYRQILGDPRHCLLVADGGEGPCGYLLGLVHPAFHANGNIGWIEELLVDETVRGAGLGRRLMEAFETWAVDEHAAGYLAVATRRAGDFYRSVGYVESAGYFKKLRRR